MQRTSKSRNNWRGRQKVALTLIAASGKKVALLRPLRKKSFHPAPKNNSFWINIVTHLRRNKPYSEKQLNRWLLVLAAKNIPHTLCPGANAKVYIPPLYTNIAISEVTAVENETSHNYLLTKQLHSSYGTLLLLFSLLFYWHAVKVGWFPLPTWVALHFPPPETWNQNFGLDAYKVSALHQWWRTVTALFLHANGQHLVSNIGIGLLFFIPLFRRIGPSLGILLPILAGTLGNLLTALNSPAYFLSIGFSTALFGGVGILTATSYFDAKENVGSAYSANPFKKLTLPFVYLAAGLSILALFGTGGQGENNIDIQGHFLGFFAGLCIGRLVPIIEKHTLKNTTHHTTLASSMLILFTVLLVVLSWWWGIATVSE